METRARALQRRFTKKKKSRSGCPSLWLQIKSAAPPFAVFDGWVPQNLRFRVYRLEVKKHEVEGDETKNMPWRRCSRFPRFEKRKGWGNLSCGATTREKVGQPADLVELMAGTLA
jgi:hypothetical protein